MSPPHGLPSTPQWASDRALLGKKLTIFEFFGQDILLLFLQALAEAMRAEEGRGREEGGRKEERRREEGCGRKEGGGGRRREEEWSGAPSLQNEDPTPQNG